MFGLVDTSHTPALGYMEVVDRRDAATLLPIIQAHTAPGTIIHSDEWSSYRRVASLPNIAAHGAVNHSLHFVDPVTGVHTQNVESYWGRVKRKIKHMKGCHATEIPTYLDEFMWKERFGKPKEPPLETSAGILQHFILFKLRGPVNLGLLILVL